MKNLLFISYYFPPIGGAGVQRSAKFVKYLPRFGWRPLVLTARAEDYGLGREFQLDGSLQAEAAEVRHEVHRVRDPAPRRLRALLERLHLFRAVWFFVYFLFWEKEFFWALAAIPRAVRLVRTRKARVMYTSSAPYSTLVIGAVVKHLTGVRWVADLRDLWTQDSLHAWPSRGHYMATVVFERFLLRRADVVIANTPLAARRLRRLLGARYGKQVVVLPNGYDAEDFPEGGGGTQRHGGRMTIVHVGTFHNLPKGTSAASPRWKRRVARMLCLKNYRPCSRDRRMRTPKGLLGGLRLVLDRRPDLRGAFRLVFVGYLNEDWLGEIKRMGLADCVEATGYVPHKEAVRRLAEADVLFCVQVGFKDRRKPVPYVPAKLYEYLATGKPVLATLAPGDAKRLLEESGLGFFADPHDAEDMARVLLELYEQHCGGGVRVMRANRELITQFERRELTRRLAVCFGGISRKCGPQSEDVSVVREGGVPGTTRRPLRSTKGGSLSRHR